MSNIKDLTGTKIGKLTLSERKREKNRTYYFCKCECGSEKWIRADTLDKITSCGCERIYTFRDLTNEKFGMLTPIKKVGMSENNGYIWSCECECGNSKDIPMSSLTAGTIVSCGCYQKERAKENIKKASIKFKEKNIIEHTNIAYIKRSNPIISNTSGFTGVCFNTNQQKWIATISFKNRRYFLGCFEEKEDAINARKEAKEKYHKNFLDWYNNKIK